MNSITKEQLNKTLTELNMVQESLVQQLSVINKKLTVLRGEQFAIIKLLKSLESTHDDKTKTAKIKDIKPESKL